MKKIIHETLVLFTLLFAGIFQFGLSQDIDTAYFLNSSPPYKLKIEGFAYTSNTNISRITNSVNGPDSVVLDIYWKHCLPAFNGYEPYDTVVNVNADLSSILDVKINSYKDTNTAVSCTLQDSIQLWTYYEVYNNIANLEELMFGDKKVVKIIDLMGYETEDKSNTVLIYVFSDGTRKKVFKVD